MVVTGNTALFGYPDMKRRNFYCCNHLLFLQVQDVMLISIRDIIEKSVQVQ